MESCNVEADLRAAKDKAVKLVDKLSYNRKNASRVLEYKITQHNEAQAGKGLKYLRSFLSNIVGFPGYEAAKPLLAALNGEQPAQAAQLAKDILNQTYEDAASHFAASQIALCVKKYPFDSLPDVARANGLRKFHRGENRNRHMNHLWRLRAAGWANGHKAPFYLHSVRSYIASVLGSKPNFRKWSGLAGWGPGASVGVSGMFTNFAQKLLAEEWTCTPTALPYALTIAKRLPMFWEVLDLRFPRPCLINGEVATTVVTCVDPDEFTRRFMQKVVLVQYNKIACVPKDADEYRIIASEPLLNQLCQVAADNEMRLKLCRFGIDLSNQEQNAIWAREGSCEGYNTRCTIDLSNASGSIFTVLVREVLAYVPDWFVALNSIRSPAWIDPKDSCDPTRYHMFSSMGNGFTFPLETLIFAAICKAAHDYCGTTPDFRCYGDDIVVRQNEALVVLEILRDMGFVANAGKTFLFGPFRESCGSDWYSGTAVRPVVFDTPLEKLEERIRVFNAFTRLPNRDDASRLSNACINWFPPFIADMLRPFADETDEALDCRHVVGPPCPDQHRCTTFDAPAWYGLVFDPVSDNEIKHHHRYSGALLYAAVNGAMSKTPFAARRETTMRVARFSHSGNTSSWLPPPQVQKFFVPKPKQPFLSGWSAGF